MGTKICKVVISQIGPFKSRIKWVIWVRIPLADIPFADKRIVVGWWWAPPTAGILSDTTTVDVRVGELPAPRPGDLIILGADSFVVQGEPVRDRERLIWTLDLRPA